MDDDMNDKPETETSSVLDRSALFKTAQETDAVCQGQQRVVENASSLAAKRTIGESNCTSLPSRPCAKFFVPAGRITKTAEPFLTNASGSFPSGVSAAARGENAVPSSAVSDPSAAATERMPDDSESRLYAGRDELDLYHHEDASNSVTAATEAGGILVRSFTNTGRRFVVDDCNLRLLKDQVDGSDDASGTGVVVPKSSPGIPPIAQGSTVSSSLDQTNTGKLSWTDAARKLSLRLPLSALSENVREASITKAVVLDPASSRYKYPGRLVFQTHSGRPPTDDLVTESVTGRGKENAEEAGVGCPLKFKPVTLGLRQILNAEAAQVKTDSEVLITTHESELHGISTSPVNASSLAENAAGVREVGCSPSLETKHEVDDVKQTQRPETEESTAHTKRSGVPDEGGLRVISNLAAVDDPAIDDVTSDSLPENAGICEISDRCVLKFKFYDQQRTYDGGELELKIDEESSVVTESGVARSTSDSSVTTVSTMADIENDSEPVKAGVQEVEENFVPQLEPVINELRQARGAGPVEPETDFDGSALTADNEPLVADTLVTTAETSKGHSLVSEAVNCGEHGSNTVTVQASELQEVLATNEPVINDLQQVRVAGLGEPKTIFDGSTLTADNDSLVANTLVTTAQTTESSKGTETVNCGEHEPVTVHARELQDVLETGHTEETEDPRNFVLSQDNGVVSGFVVVATSEVKTETRCRPRDAVDESAVSQLEPVAEEELREPKYAGSAGIKTDPEDNITGSERQDCFSTPVFPTPMPGDSAGCSPLSKTESCGMAEKRAEESDEDASPKQLPPEARIGDVDKDWRDDVASDTSGSQSSSAPLIIDSVAEDVSEEELHLTKDAEGVNPSGDAGRSAENADNGSSGISSRPVASASVADSVEASSSSSTGSPVKVDENCALLLKQMDNDLPQAEAPAPIKQDIIAGSPIFTQDDQTEDVSSSLIPARPKYEDASGSSCLTEVGSNSLSKTTEVIPLPMGEAAEVPELQIARPDISSTENSELGIVSKARGLRFQTLPEGQSQTFCQRRSEPERVNRKAKRPHDSADTYTVIKRTRSVVTEELLIVDGVPAGARMTVNNEVHFDFGLMGASSSHDAFSTERGSSELPPKVDVSEELTRGSALTVTDTAALEGTSGANTQDSLILSRHEHQSNEPAVQAPPLPEVSIQASDFEQQDQPRGQRDQSPCVLFCDEPSDSTADTEEDLLVRSLAKARRISPSSSLEARGSDDSAWPSCSQRARDDAAEVFYDDNAVSGSGPMQVAASSRGRSSSSESQRPNEIDDIYDVRSGAELTPAYLERLVLAPMGHELRADAPELLVNGWDNRAISPPMSLVPRESSDESEDDESCTLHTTSTEDIMESDSFDSEESQTSSLSDSDSSSMDDYILSVNPFGKQAEENNGRRAGVESEEVNDEEELFTFTDSVAASSARSTVTAASAKHPSPPTQRSVQQNREKVTQHLGTSPRSQYRTGDRTQESDSEGGASTGSELSAYCQRDVATPGTLTVQKSRLNESAKKRDDDGSHSASCNEDPDLPGAEASSASDTDHQLLGTASRGLVDYSQCTSEECNDAEDSDSTAHCSHDDSQRSLPEKTEDTREVSSSTQVHPESYKKVMEVYFNEESKSFMVLPTTSDCVVPEGVRARELPGGSGCPVAPATTSTTDRPVPAELCKFEALNEQVASERSAVSVPYKSEETVEPQGAEYEVPRKKARRIGLSKSCRGRGLHLSWKGDGNN
ncbi:uncharacterized protein LOC144159536 [Haemaphysalis longicornis]